MRNILNYLYLYNKINQNSNKNYIYRKKININYFLKNYNKKNKEE